MHTLHVTESAQEESSLCIYNAFTVYAQTTQTHDRILPPASPTAGFVYIIRLDSLSIFLSWVQLIHTVDTVLIMLFR